MSTRLRYFAIGTTYKKEQTKMNKQRCITHLVLQDCAAGTSDIAILFREMYQQWV
jgi:hypothetical protein